MAQSTTDLTKQSKESAILPVETFAKLPFVGQAELSPDGQQIAGVFGIGGEQRIMIVPLFSDKNKSVQLAVPDETEVDWIQWVNNDNIIVRLRGLIRVEADRWYITRMIAVNRTSGKPTKLLWQMKGQNAANLLWSPSDGSNEILMAAQNSIYVGEDFWPAVYRVDVTNGKLRKVVKGRRNVMDWGADQTGSVRYGIGYQDFSTDATLVYRGEGQKGSFGFKLSDKAKLVNEESLTVPFMFLPGSDNGLVLKDNADDRTVVMEVNLVTGKDVQTFFEAENADIKRVFLSFDRSKILGVRTDDEENPIHWIDPAMKAAQEQIDAAAPKATARIESFNRDQTKMIVRISTPDNPGLLYYYDAAVQKLAKIASVNKAVGNKRLAKSKLVKYNARDGLEIEGVLTLPKGREHKNLPFIVMPHGGPWAHDILRYDYWVQFLANRGYAVLQPNFRGSTGYGAKFERLGQGQMGLAMQDDVSDGVSWAVEQGIADPNRVCIVGASYGGYAAMWGIAKDPDQYRCAVSIAGVSNLRREVNDFGSNFRAKLFRSQWKKMTPDFKAVSPINAIDKIKAPLLLIHGKKDVTVDYVQSKKMNSAMKKASKQVEYVLLAQADHYFSREADRLVLLNSMEDFLRKHNPAD
ncbi:MAG: S9 family peptidase [Parasphingorhabdus sp.]